MAISKYLDEGLVVFLHHVKNRNDAILALIDQVDATGRIPDKNAFYQAILEREKLVSTGIGVGVAIPHAKLPGYEHFFIAIGVQNKPGIAWNSLDGMPVHLIFMIGGPDNKQAEYLKILSYLTIAIKNEERRKKILQALRPKQVIELFEGC